MTAKHVEENKGERCNRPKQYLCTFQGLLNPESTISDNGLGSVDVERVPVMSHANKAAVSMSTRRQDVCSANKRIKLAGVKTELYNPYLASFRKAQIDTQLGLLSDEHCKTTLPIGRENLSAEKRFNYDPPSSYIPKSRMMGLEEIVKTDEEIKHEKDVRKTLEDAYQNTNGAFAMPLRRIIQIPSIKHVSYMNFRVRLLTPEPSQKWREFVHENGLLYPHGGAEFVRAKHRAAAEGEINTTAAGAGAAENKEFSPTALAFPTTFSSPEGKTEPTNELEMKENGGAADGSE